MTSTDDAPDTPISRSVAWAPFAALLTGGLATLEEDQCLILALNRARRQASPTLRTAEAATRRKRLAP